jgi:hypothetical protein
MLTKILKTLKNDKGSAYIDSAVKLIISIILAAIVLFGFFAILKSGVLPGIQAHIDGNMNGGQVQAMTDIGKAYARWKNDLMDEVNGNLDEISQSDEVRLIYGLHAGLITIEDFELSEEALFAKLPEKAVIPENDTEILIYWYYSSIQYIDGTHTTLMTREEFKNYERTDEGKAEIMEIIGS